MLYWRLYGFEKILDSSISEKRAEPILASRRHEATPPEIHFGPQRFTDLIKHAIVLSFAFIWAVTRPSV